MFKCDFCKKNSQPGDKINMVPVETRERNYSEGGFGNEIVKEAKACSPCYKENKEASPFGKLAVKFTSTYIHESDGTVTQR